MTAPTRIVSSLAARVRQDGPFWMSFAVLSLNPMSPCVARAAARLSSHAPASESGFAGYCRVEEVIADRQQPRLRAGMIRESGRQQLCAIIHGSSRSKAVPPRYRGQPRETSPDSAHRPGDRVQKNRPCGSRESTPGFGNRFREKVSGTRRPPGLRQAESVMFVTSRGRALSETGLPAECGSGETGL